MTRRRAGEPRKGDLREAAILDAAEELLGAIGYDAMTIANIAARAGITRGALYFYFGSKQEVITALFARTVAVLHEKSRAATEDAASGAKAIDTAMRRTEDLWREHGVVMRTAIDLAATVPQLDALWKQTADIFVVAITAILEHMGVPAGKGPDKSAAIAEALCWMIERNFYQASRVSPARLTRARQTCTEIWLRVAS
ncbi:MULTISPECIES: TetR/AcrR family transcriptional regulator [Mycobacterium avium complex (MAC)]|uniref:TetR/AcrR family transcriptional regulator n=3 Tax=Mycobacterium avium complex (MAC) TaxID=120793 RepID=A0A2A3L915_MYCAV|nr:MULTISPECIES: TetR/AcrR family transcriptional regulator [Mycobacterium avium complex (MAC)]ETA93187.1 TetR family transcriptional regulator [Mycobacterium avium 05-4293]ETB26279.1 TetR family transcriptional regulator [Mycobacterium avium 09-5983]ETB42442.1 TetR family transcriptional regulator [Mycobacterium avium subsp. hominissuis 10-5606]APA75382.1 TetR/AcrR family transcriptional regulator [Mycobacterium avium subsp. hominissuis]APT11332.1 TetR family transcriptional regulator [Mycoba